MNTVVDDVVQHRSGGLQPNLKLTREKTTLGVNALVNEDGDTHACRNGQGTYVRHEESACRLNSNGFVIPK